MSIKITGPDISRMNAYSTPLPDGGVEIDCEGMAVDLIVALKAFNCPRAEFISKLTALWDEIQVETFTASRGGH